MVFVLINRSYFCLILFISMILLSGNESMFVLPNWLYNSLKSTNLNILKNTKFIINFFAVVGLSSGEYSPMDIKCQDGDCASDEQCNTDCVNKGFKNGGTCRIIYPSSNKCCCTIG